MLLIVKYLPNIAVYHLNLRRSLLFRYNCDINYYRHACWKLRYNNIPKTIEHFISLALFDNTNFAAADSEWVYLRHFSERCSEPAHFVKRLQKGFIFLYVMFGTSSCLCFWHTCLIGR
jgi:hypothetical protein